MKNPLKHDLYTREAIEETPATAGADAAIAHADSRHRVICFTSQIAPGRQIMRALGDVPTVVELGREALPTLGR
jgi:hypothetical protein